MTKLQLTGHFDAENVVDEVAFQLSPDAVLEFMVSLDMAMADAEFTQKLIRRLRQSLEDEGEIPLSEQLFDLRENIAAASQRVAEASHLLNKMELDSLE